LSGKGLDVLIVGGGVMGSSIAYHLLKDGLDGTVGILERDPTYEFATTPRSAGGIRQQFSTEINIRIGLFSLERFERFDQEMEVDGEPAHAEFRQRGYLFLADERNWEALKRQHRIQKALGATVELLSGQEVLEIMPDLKVDGLLGASWGPKAGYTDPYGVLQGYLRKARSMGAHYVHGDAAELLCRGSRIRGVRTREGQLMEAGCVVLAAGAWSGDLAATAGIHIPVEPHPRMAYCFDPAEKFHYDLPLVIDPEGLYFRHESGRQILTGKSRNERPGYRFDWDRDFFMKEIWPALYRWVPAFERLKLLRGWAGLYEMCTWDRNGLLGEYPGLEGLFVATGFSGHGFQQAPAVGQGLSELILTGRYQSLDLSALNVGRIFTGQRVLEEGVV
jgi:FAD-dependent oxidoreductase domain-containing protein 1